MSLTIILSIIIIILIMAMVLNQKFMKDRIETEEYARNQLISKNSTLSEENLSLKNQMLSTNNDVGQHAFKNAKRELRKILNRFKEEGRLRSFTIVPTSNLAVKHPLFEYARSFDFIIITDVGLINVDVKNWNQKTFYHFDVPDQHLEEGQPQYNTEKVVGHYISNRYHSQFKTTRSGVYTFIEILQDNRVIYEKIKLKMIIILKFKVLASSTLVMVALILLKDPTRVINMLTPYLLRYHLKK